MNPALLFEAEPMVHPNILDAYEQAVRIQTLIKRLKLPLGYANRLAPEVRPAYRRLWVEDSS